MIRPSKGPKEEQKQRFFSSNVYRLPHEPRNPTTKKDVYIYIHTALYCLYFFYSALEVRGDLGSPFTTL